MASSTIATGPICRPGPLCCRLVAELVVLAAPVVRCGLARSNCCTWSAAEPVQVELLRAGGHQVAELLPLVLHPVLRQVELQRAELLPLLATRPSCCAWSSCRRSVSALLLPAITAAGAELLQVELLQAVELLAGGHQVAELLPLVRY